MENLLLLAGSAYLQVMPEEECPAGQAPRVSGADSPGEGHLKLERHLAYFRWK